MTSSEARSASTSSSTSHGGNGIDLRTETVAASIPPAPRTRRPRLSWYPSDVLLLASLVLWAIGVSRVNTSAINGYGLLQALPLIYFTGIGLWAVSTALALARRESIGPRLLGYLIALVVMIHATAPIVYSQARYAGMYKHVGVVQFINLHGQLLHTVDIYQNWPGFFALSAMLDRVAGVSSPLAYAAWAQLFFNLLILLVLNFALQRFALTTRQRWFTLFLFVAANWVGQDYFAPQAIGFVLSVAIVGVAMRWFSDDSVAPWVLSIARRFTKPERDAAHAALGRELLPTEDRRPAGALTLIITLFAFLVVTHQISPYLVVLQLAVLTVLGLLRPRWLVPAMLAIALCYFLPRLSIVESQTHALSSFGHLFNNFQSPSTQHALSPGRQLAAGASLCLSLGVWALALVGALRRFRSGDPPLRLVALAFSPLLILPFTGYGSEAILRVFLFSLPWSAVLVSSALKLERPPIRKTHSGQILSFGVLFVSLGLLLPAFFGNDGVARVQPGELHASQQLYRLQPGVVLLVDQNFPAKVDARYNLFSQMAPLLNRSTYRDRLLGQRDLSAIEKLIAGKETQQLTTGYLVVSSDQRAFADAFRLTPPGSFPSLQNAIESSKVWQTRYKNSNAAIYQLIHAPLLAPSNITATVSGNGRMSVAFGAVPAVPGNPVVDYVAACQAPGQQTRTASGSNTPIIVGGLKGGVAYNCYARARNVQGGGPSSRPVTVTARSAPTSAPTTVSGIVAGNGTIQLTPAVVDSSGDGGLGITGYAAVCQAVGQPTRTASSSGGPIILTGMRGGVTYTCVVRARNIFGGGPPSLPISVAAESSPTAAPSAVTAVVASNGRAELTPAPLANSGDGGLPINGYAALCRAPGQPNRAGMSGETSVTVTGLARGVSYTCVVRAHNQFGGGPPSPPVTVAVPHTRPVAPGRSSR